MFWGTQIPLKNKLGRNNFGGEPVGRMVWKLCACKESSIYTGCFEGKEFDGEGTSVDSSELPLGTSCLLGCWGWWQGRKRPENWSSGEGSATRQSPPGWGTKLLILYSGKQGLTVPDEPSPAESRLGTTTEGLSKHRMLVLLPLCEWLLPPGAQQVPRSQPGLCGEQGGREERKSVSLGSEDGFSLAATARRYRPWTSVYPSARGG